MAELKRNYNTIIPPTTHRKPNTQQSSNIKPTTAKNTNPKLIKNTTIQTNKHEVHKSKT